MTRTLMLTAAVLLPASADAKPRAVSDPGHEYHFTDTGSVEASGFQVRVADALTTANLTKMKVVIANGTEDWAIYKPHETAFNYPSGASFNAQGGMRGGLKLSPQKESSRVLKVEGTDLHHESVEVEVGGLYVVAADSPVIDLPDFQLPLASNTTGGEDLACVVAGKVVQQTDETIVKFKCSYAGNQSILVNSTRMQVKAEGQLFTNVAGSQKIQLLLPGEDLKLQAKFTVPVQVCDMQKSTLHIVWNDAFRRGKLNPVTPVKIPLVLDVAETEAQNR